MLAIRMRRVGASKNPLFRVVVTESASPRDGRFIEALGYYNPRSKPETLQVNRDRLTHWLKAGARPSATVRTLLARQKPEAGATAESSTP